MSIPARIVGLSCIAALWLASPSTAAAQDACKDVLTYAARNYMIRFSEEDRKSWVYSHKCGANSSSNSVGLNALVDAVPVGLSFSGSDTQKWCEENNRLENNRSIAAVIDSEVSVPAINNWASCMQADSHGLGTRIEHVSNVTSQMILWNKTPYPEQLTDLLVQSDEGSGIACAPMPAQGSPVALPVAREVLISCTRTYVDVTRQGQSYKVLPGGSITASTTLRPYSYGFPEQFREERTPKPPTREVIPLAGIFLGTRAYWASGQTSELLPCNRIKTPPEFDLVEVSTNEQPVKGLNPRGICGTAPYCDSAGEICKEVYYTQACIVNKEWHDWYKEDAQKRGIPYSKESVCG